MNFEDLKREAAEAYLDFTVTYEGEDLVMLSPLRLSDANRAKLRVLFEAVDEDSDQESVLEGVITLTSATPATSRKLLTITKGDLPLRATLINNYQKVVALGEASDSPS